MVKRAFREAVAETRKNGQPQQHLLGQVKRPDSSFDKAPWSTKLFRKCSQLRQKYLNNCFQAEVGKELPKQFPEPPSVGKLDVVLKSCKRFASQRLPKILSERVNVGILLPDYLLK